MQFGQDRRTMTNADARAVHMDVGLRKYMLGVYNYMASALALTGIVAMVASQSQTLMMAIHGSPLKWVMLIGLLGFCWFFSSMVTKLSASKAQMLFWAFAAFKGLFLSYIFLVFSGAMIATAFFSTAIAFGSLSLYGYTTKRDLAPMGKFLFMALIGLIVVMVINIFIGSTMLQLGVCSLGVLVMCGITAYETQQVKDWYYEGDTTEVATKKSIIGAFGLYITFINMFIMILQMLNILGGDE